MKRKAAASVRHQRRLDPLNASRRRILFAARPAARSFRRPRFGKEVSEFGVGVLLREQAH